MAVKFHSLKVKEVRNETADAVSVHFDVPDDLAKSYGYQAGQYLTLKFFLEGQEYRRAYSLCTSPVADDLVAIAVKRVEGGKISNHINDNLSAGSEVEVMQPMGNFTIDFNEFYARHFILYAGGSGITPMMSLLKTALTVEQSSQVTLIYGNRDADSVIFHKELDELEGHYADRFKIIQCLASSDDTWTGETGLLDASKVKSILGNLDTDLNKAQHFICGPGPMMEQVKQALSDLAVPSDRIHIEYFSASISQNDDAEDQVEAAEDFDGKAEVEISLNGESHSVGVLESETILEAAMNKGIDPPYACQMGICTTCRAKLSEGLVQMSETEGLTQEEIDNGYVLTCQAHPKSAKISLAFE